VAASPAILESIMRIVEAVSLTEVNGVGVHCHLLMKYLQARGHVIMLLHRPGAWIAAQPGLDRVYKLETSFARSPRELLRVGRLVSAFKPDVMHTHMSGAHAYGAATRLFGSLPVVATSHVALFQLHWAFNNLVIATSRAAADFNRRYNFVLRDAIRMIPNFVDTGRLRPPDDAERATARARLGVPDDAFVVGSVGHLAGYKRPADLVRAFAALAPRPQARLVMIGRADMDAAGEAAAEARKLGLSDRVLFTGTRGDATDLLAAMDVFALASGRETAPLAILEAMARGLPVVATRVGMVPDMVQHGRTGLLAEIGDVAALGRHLVALADNPEQRRAFGEAGRAHAVRSYAVSVGAPRVEQVLAEAMAIHNRPLFGFVGRLATQR
jgi:glycosyltransferase involved in cell wall biosynthesis